MELLVAIAITAMVFAMVSAILFSVLSANDKVEEKLRTEKAGYGCLSLLRRDLEACYCYGLGGPALLGEKASESGKQADRITLVVAALGPPDDKGRITQFQKVGYRLSAGEGGAEGLGLYRHAQAYNPGDDLAAGGEFSLVYQGIESLKLAYYDGKEKRWVDDEWKEQERVPRAVRVELVLAHDKGHEEAARAANVELPQLKFQIVVGILSAAAPPEEQATLSNPGTTPGPGGVPPPGGGGGGGG